MTRCAGVLAVGGSAGGVEALIELVARLPADLPVPVLVTVHVGRDARSNLPRILSRAGPLPATHGHDGEPLRAGRIYVAPPDLHLLVTAGTVRLSSGPRVNRHRPAVDVMFASAARWGGRCAVAVILSGMRDDGAVGAALIARAGGRVVVQDPMDALFESMPRAVLAAVPSAATAPAAWIAATAAAALAELRAGDAASPGQSPSGGSSDVPAAPRPSWGATDPAAPPETDGEEPEMVDVRMGDSDDPGFLGADETRLTRLSCPECNGGLAELDLVGIRYYRCHVGHQYAPQSLEAAQRDAVEAKLWAAAAALEEHAALARHLATRPDEAVDATAAAHYHDIADQSARTARTLLAGMTHRQPPAPAVPPGHLAGGGA